MTKPYHGEPDGLMNNAWRNLAEAAPERLDPSRMTTRMRPERNCSDTMHRLDRELGRFAQAFASGRVR